MNQVVFIQQNYQPDNHLNPITHKLKHSILKKSNIFRPKNQPHNRYLSLDNMGSLRRKGFNPEESISTEYKQQATRLQQVLRKNNETQTANANVSNNRQENQQKSFLIGRNKALEQQLDSKNQKIVNLARKCQELQTKLIACQNCQLSSSFSCFTQSALHHKNLSFSNVSDRSSHLQKLRAIQQRLRKVSFSKFFKIIHQHNKEEV